MVQIIFSFPHSMPCFCADVNIWLVTFGFHLHNAIPGFPIPQFDLTEPSLEMTKSQLWDDLAVSFPCAGLTSLLLFDLVWFYMVFYSKLFD